MNNIYFVIKVVEPTDGQEERYPQVFGGEKVCVYTRGKIEVSSSEL